MKVEVLAVALLLLAGQPAQTHVESLRGRYVSSDRGEMGVMVFRPDGVLGYKAPSKHVLYSEERLPPNRARYRVVADSKVEVSGLAPGETPFTLEIQDAGRVLVLTRVEGTMPRRALYRKQ